VIKDTIAARKNTSPQNIYEIAQLYAVGALRVACIGIQCVGFNSSLYHALLDDATRYAYPGGSRLRSSFGANMSHNSPISPSFNMHSNWLNATAQPFAPRLFTFATSNISNV
jgi:hypothetical protein